MPLSRCMQAIVLLAAATPFPSAAMAAVSAGCYERSYDAAHMAGHPRQSVTRIAVEVKTPGGVEPYAASASLSARMRGRKTRMYTGGDCMAEGEGLSCAMDDDSGSFLLTQNGGGLKLVNTADIRLHRLDRGPEDDGAAYLRGKDSEERIFLLLPAPAKACR